MQPHRVHATGGKAFRQVRCIVMRRKIGSEGEIHAPEALPLAVQHEVAVRYHHARRGHVDRPARVVRRQRIGRLNGGNDEGYERLGRLRGGNAGEGVQKKNRSDSQQTAGFAGESHGK